MSDRVHVSMELDVFVDDEQAMRQSAFERMRAAWNSSDDFPFESPGDVPLGQVIQSVLAAALPLEITGGRRSQLAIETDESVSDDKDSKDSTEDEDSDDKESKDEDADDKESKNEDADDKESTEDENTDDSGDDGDDSDDDSGAKKSD